MRIKQFIALALAIVMVATVFVPAVSAADDDKGIDLTATVLEPKPEVGITVDTDRIDFGELFPGETSSSHDIMATNVGLKPIEVTMDVQDDGNGVFEQGIEIDGNVWNDYSAQLISDDSDSFGVALHVPDDTAAREAVSGVMTVFAQAIETPVAEFSANVTSGVAPLDVQFTDLSANGPTSWAWDFGDGSTSTEQNPSHEYSAAGSYTVSLTASHSAGSDTEVKADYITVTEAAPMTEDWPMFQGGPYHGGVTIDQGPTSSASVAWSAQVSTSSMSGIEIPPTIADGKVFVVDMKGYVYAYSVGDGTPLWVNTNLVPGTSTFQLSTPAYHNGVLYVALLRALGSGVDVFALNATDGSMLWSNLQIATGYCQPNTPVIYDGGHIYFGVWYSSDGPGKYVCLYASNGTTLWQRASVGLGYYWAGAAVIGNYLVYGDENAHIVSVNKLTGATVQDATLSTVFGLASTQIRSSVSYSDDTHRIYFTTKSGYCCALGFDANTGHFVTTDNWKTSIGQSTSTPAIYGGKVYVGIGDFSTANTKLYCLSEVDGSIAWTFVANGGIQSSPVVSLNSNGQVYIYFTTNSDHGRVYCVDSSGNEKWHFEPPTGQVQYVLQGVAVYDGMVLFGNDAGWLFALSGE